MTPRRRRRDRRRRLLADAERRRARRRRAGAPRDACSRRATSRSRPTAPSTSPTPATAAPPRGARRHDQDLRGRRRPRRARRRRARHGGLAARAARAGARRRRHALRRRGLARPRPPRSRPTAASRPRRAAAAGGLGDGGPATEAVLDLPTDVAVDEQGTLFVADALNHRVRRVDATGRDRDDRRRRRRGLRRRRRPGDGRLDRPALRPRRRRRRHRLRRPTACTTSSGASTARGASRPSPARASAARTATAAPRCRPTSPSRRTSPWRRTAPCTSPTPATRASAAPRPGLPGFTDADFSLPSEDGTEVYMFDRDGRHLRTVEALTGAVKWTFGYDGAGRLTTVTDGSATPNVTTIERDGAGKPTAIVAPGGIRTALALRPADGWLGAITAPGTPSVTLDYFAGRPAEDAHRPARPLRRVHLRRRRAAGDRPRQARQDADASTATATATGFRVTRTSHEGRETVFESETLPGGDVRTTTTEPSGAVQQHPLRPRRHDADDGGQRHDHGRRRSAPTRAGACARRSPTSIVKTTPRRPLDGGRRAPARSQLAGAGDPFDVDTLTRHVRRSTARGHTRTYDGATRTLTTETRRARARSPPASTRAGGSSSAASAPASSRRR